MTHALIAFSDTGGGHRAAATAIRAALAAFRPEISTELIDPFAHCARWPFRSLSTQYPRVVESAPWLWHAGFTLTNTPRRTALVQRLAWPAMRPAFRDIARTHAPDVIVSTHPLLTAPLRAVFPDTPLMVTVTDLVSGHVSWYSPEADLTTVPTIAARDAAIRCGVSSARVSVTGAPVLSRFVAVPGERAALQRELGWTPDRATVLVAGGAEGIGPLEHLAAAIDDAELPCDLAVIAGRNAALAARLRRRPWRGTVHVYDFVNNLPEMMRAAAVLLTKAGPGTISEACASGCPMILYGAIPGQETGNIGYVTAGRAGVWAPSSLAVTAALHAWLVGRDAPAALRRASAGALRLARPDAAHEIADWVVRLAHARADGLQFTPDVVRETLRTAAA
jgi:1,2-diacylglycerol 3-beta-galactosyltransferase